MNVSDSTLQQLQRALRKVAQKFQEAAGAEPLTDIHLMATPDSGELRVYDDDDRELTRCVVEEWIGNSDEDFYDIAAKALTEAIRREAELLSALHLLKPYSFVLIGENHETLKDLYLVDDDTIILDEELMKGLSEDLDHFWEELCKQ